jgi:phosphopantothenoylcysteine decarboxylase/phosphopantothenate--cysteine ligase
MKILVTGGPTREPIDEVRYITNRSSGKMAYSIAGAASGRGAEVTMITGPTFLEVPQGVNAVHIKTAGEMLSSVVSQIGQNEWLIMVAAVADFTPETSGKGKIKKDSRASLNLKLVATRDILSEVKKSSKGKLIVGFAAETDDMDKNAVAKLKSKELDLIVANDVSRDGAGFESDNNQAVIFYRDGGREDLPLMSKREMAHRILDASLKVWMKKEA